jgi:hypothetical protein
MSLPRPPYGLRSYAGMVWRPSRTRAKLAPVRPNDKITLRQGARVVRKIGGLRRRAARCDIVPS